MRTINKWIVTGAAGFIGNAIYNKLINSNCTTIGLDRNPEKINNNTNIIKSNLINDEDLIRYCDSNTIVLHFGESANVVESYNNPEEYLDQSFRTNIKVLEVIRKTKARLVYPSTGSIFSKYNEMPLAENSIINPSSPYASGKLNGESMCMSYRNSYDLDIRIVRLFSVYGSTMKSFFIYDAINKIYKAKDKVVFYGSGRQIRDYMYIEDVVNGLIKISVSDFRNEDYNLGSGVATSIFDLAEKIKKYLNKNNLIIEFDKSCQPFQSDVFFADANKVNKLGIKSMMSIDDGLKIIIPHIIKKIQYI